MGVGVATPFESDWLSCLCPGHKVGPAKPQQHCPLWPPHTPTAQHRPSHAPEPDQPPPCPPRPLWDSARVRIPPGRGNTASCSPAILPSMGACGTLGREHAPSALQPSPTQCGKLRDSSLPRRDHLIRSGASGWLRELASPRSDGCCRRPPRGAT